jgi:hypothetical protein
VKTIKQNQWHNKIPWGGKWYKYQRHEKQFSNVVSNFALYVRSENVLARECLQSVTGHSHSPPSNSLPQPSWTTNNFRSTPINRRPQATWSQQHWEVRSCKKEHKTKKKPLTGCSGPKLGACDTDSLHFSLSSHLQETGSGWLALQICTLEVSLSTTGPESSYRDTTQFFQCLRPRPLPTTFPVTHHSQCSFHQALQSRKGR